MVVIVAMVGRGQWAWWWLGAFGFVWLFFNGFVVGFWLVCGWIFTGFMVGLVSWWLLCGGDWVAVWRWCGWEGGCCVDRCIGFSLWYLTTGWERGRETEIRERMKYILLYNLYYFNVLYCKIKVRILRVL